MRASSLPEAPGALPVLGHALQLWRRPLPFLRELTGLGEVVTLRLGPQRVYLAVSAGAVSQVLFDPRTFDKGGPLFERARLVVGDGLVSSGFETHRRQRRLIQPAFAAERISTYATPMREQVEAELGTWGTGRAFDVRRAMHGLALRVAARTMFGARLPEPAVTAVVEALPVIMRGVYQRMIIPGERVHRLPLPANRRFERAQATMRQVIADTVRAHRRVGRDQGDVLSILADRDAPAPLRDEEIHDQVMTMLIGGTEPPGDALSWVLHLLAAHPDAERSVHAEVDGVLDGGSVRPEHLPALGTVRRTIIEALRLYPPAWLLTRTVTRDTVLAGHPVARGSTVLFSPYQRHHDPEVFPDPLRFDPHRWSDPSPAARASLLPFGAGNRKCIGDELALTELAITLAGVVSRYRLRRAPGSVVRPVARASLSPGRLMMVPEPRGVARRTPLSVPGRRTVTS